MSPDEKRILVVEDDDTVIDLLEIRLSRAGYKTFVVRDGQSALTEAARVRPHGIILDIGLPGLDGFGVLDQLKADPLLRSVPVLVLTARHSASDVGLSIAKGAMGYLSKPFDEKNLLARVARLVQAAA